MANISARSKTKRLERAIFAAGCFWGVQAYFKQLEGVRSTMAGYAGGEKDNPTYEDVIKGDTGHAEAILIEFDPKIISYQDLLQHFFRMHDPTTLNRQGNDAGTQYRSAIFYFNEDQKKKAAAAIAANQPKWEMPIVTEIKKAGKFYPAEDYHQDYLDKNPGGYCHVDLSKAKIPLEDLQ